MATCRGTKRDGTPCMANTIPGEPWCYNHDPANAEERRLSASRAATAKHSSLGRELGDLRELIVELVGVLFFGALALGVRRELQSVVQLLQCYLRAAELEMRAAEEPLRSDLDVKNLKSQVMGRIEELEEREREREEILSELLPVMEARGYETGSIRTLIGG